MFDCRLLADLGGGRVALLCDFEVLSPQYPRCLFKEIFGSIGFVCHKEYLAQKSDLNIKGEDNSLLFEGVGNMLPQRSFSGKCRKFVRS